VPSVEPVDRVWAGGGKRASVFHGLSMPYPRAERGP